MRLSHRALLLGALCLLLLVGCGESTDTGSNTILTPSADSSGSSSSGGGGGNDPPTGFTGGDPTSAGQNETVVATPTVADPFKVAIGSKGTLGVTFTSSDGGTVSGLAINDSLTMLPSGWTGPKTFACASVSTGSGCVLNLTFAPTVYGPGSLTLDYVFIRAAGEPETGGSITIPYFATVHNNVVATASPTGQINAVVDGQGQTVTVTFTTDDGYPASSVMLTNLASLTAPTTPPNPWSVASSSLPCGTVSTGNSCQLALTFAPMTFTLPTKLTLAYSFVDNAGTARTGTLNIPYAAAGAVVGTYSPSGQISAAVGGSPVPVTVTFATNDGNPAANLVVTTNLSQLPDPAWSSSVAAFSCTEVSSPSVPCPPFTLTYTPTPNDNGTLTLNYSYTNDLGATQNGSISIPYVTTP